MRLLGQTLVVATAIGLALTVAPACVDNDQSLYVRQVVAPPDTKSETGGCVYKPDATGTALFEGTLDLLIAQNYSAVILVGNQLIQRSDNLSARAESNKAHLDGAIVRVTDADGNDIREFTSPAAGFADNSNGIIASFGLARVTLIDSATVNSLARSITTTKEKLVLANIKVFGETLGGVDLESGEFQFPIRICRGCLISFLGADDPNSDGVDCNLQNTAAAAGGASDTLDRTKLPCQAGQDEYLPCTACKGNRIPDPTDSSKTIDVCSSAADQGKTNPQ